MKNTLTNGLIALTLIVTTIAFKPNTMERKKVNVNKSNIEWKGKKLTGSHNGTITLKEGHFTFDGNTLTGGKFVMDMTSINVTDLSGESKEKLEGHLNSDDFFGVNNYPESTLKITNVAKKGNSYGITADLTIKGKTNPVTFDLEIDDVDATTTLKVDRTKYGIKYGSGSFFDNLGDNTIYDDFTLSVNLKF